MAEQGTHKPLVDGSNPFLATTCIHDQQLRSPREVVGHSLVKELAMADFVDCYDAKRHTTRLATQRWPMSILLVPYKPDQ